MKQTFKNAAKAFSIELPLYAVLVTAYVFFVLHFLGGWLFGLFTSQRKLYAIVALLLVTVQGYFLEVLSRALLGWVKGKKEK